MTLSQTVQDSICLKLRGVGLEEALVRPIVDSMVKQINAEGFENVVKRLKIIKQAAVNHIAGQEIDLQWVAHTKFGGPKGPWKPVWKQLMSFNHKHKKRALNAMMVYASIVLPKAAGPTKNQEKKFVDSVVQPPNPMVLKRIKYFTESSSFRKALTEVRSSNFRQYTAEWEQPDVYLARQLIGDANPEKRVVVMNKIREQITKFFGETAFRPLHAFPEVQGALGDIGYDLASYSHPWNGYHLDWTKTPVLEEAIGVVGFTHEPGLKFRAFAAPNRLLQSALEPLKVHLQSYLYDQKTDRTRDQDKGVNDVQKWLQEGKTVYSVDLSDATNNFPLELQLNVLRQLGTVPDSAIKLMEVISRAPFKVTWDKKNNSTITWTKGQPLGFGPSFPLFALTHNVLVRAIEISLGVSDTFRILGDDFVTCDAGVHKKYREFLSRFECPISESKCLTSKIAGEFAGKLITKDMIFHGYKYREVSDLSFMSVVRTLGRQALSPKFLTAGQYSYAWLVRDVPEPYGLGFNPHGISFAKRYANYLEIQEEMARQKLGDTKESVASLRNEYLYSQRFTDRKSRQSQLAAIVDLGHGGEGYTRSNQTVQHGTMVTSDLLFESLHPSERVSIMKVSGDPRTEFMPKLQPSVLKKMKEMREAEDARKSELKEVSTPRVKPK